MKKFYSLLIAGFLAAGIIGCSSSSTSAPAGGSPTEKKTDKGSDKGGEKGAEKAGDKKEKM